MADHVYDIADWLFTCMAGDSKRQRAAALYILPYCYNSLNFDNTDCTIFLYCCYIPFYTRVLIQFQSTSGHEAGFNPLMDVD